MKNLEKLYDEVAPEYIKYESKIDETGEKVRSLIEEMDAAKTNYDVDAMERINGKLSALKQVDDQIRNDFEQHKKQVNDRSGLYNKVIKCLQSDVLVDQQDQEIQAAFKKITELKKQVNDLQLSILHKEIEKREQYTEVLGKFSRFIDQSNNFSAPSLASMHVKYYPHH